MPTIADAIAGTDITTGTVVETVEFVRGIIVQKIEEGTGETSFDVVFPSTSGQTRVLSDMLSDLAERSVASGHYPEIAMTVLIRDGLEVIDGLIPGYGGSSEDSDAQAS